MGLASREKARTTQATADLQLSHVRLDFVVSRVIHRTNEVVRWGGFVAFFIALVATWVLLLWRTLQVGL
jgi:TRAP-type mannitol/chloroaromatic compound transport system permease small subunit